MYIYWILFFLLLCCSFNYGYKVNNDRSIFIILCSLLILIASLRAETVGSDTIEYIDSFKNVKYSDISEQGYIYISRLIHDLFGNNIFIFQLIFTFIFMGGVIISIKKDSPSINESLFILLISGFYLAYFNTQRQYIAISLLLPFIPLIKTHDIKSNIIFLSICLLIGFLFHNSVIFMFVLPFLYNIKIMKNKKIMFTIITISFIIAILFDIREIISSILSFLPVSKSYASFVNLIPNERSIYSLSFRYIYVVLLLVLIPPDSLENIYIFTMFCGFPLFFTIGMIFAGARISENFFLSQIIAIPYLLHNYKYSYCKLLLLNTLVYLYLFYTFSGRILENHGEIIPYKLIN